MTRGKSATKAANREKVVADRTAHLDRQIARLETQLAERDRQNLEQQAHHEQAVRDLRAKLSASTSEQVKELTTRVKTLTDDNAALELHVADVQKLWANVTKNLIGRFREGNGGDHRAAIEEFMRLSGLDPEHNFGVVTGEDYAASRKLDAKGVSAVRLARRKHGR